MFKPNKLFKLITKSLPFLLVSSGIVYLNYKDYKQNQLKSFTENVEIIADKTGSIYYHIADLGNSFEYKKSLLQKLTGVTISKNLSEEHLDMMIETADKYNIPYKIYFRMGAKESYNFSSTKSSRKGAKYYFQIMPETFRDYAKHLNIKKHNVKTNILVSGYIISDLYKKYGDWTRTVAAYNAGTTNVARYNGVPKFKETIAYVDYVLNSDFETE